MSGHSFGFGAIAYLSPTIFLLNDLEMLKGTGVQSENGIPTVLRNFYGTTRVQLNTYVCLNIKEKQLMNNGLARVLPAYAVLHGVSIHVSKADAL